MPKAEIQHLQDAGFRAEQFGTPSDFTTPSTGYLARKLNEAGRWAEARVGADAYAAAATPSLALDRLTLAETAYASAQLWRARTGFLDSNAMQGRDHGAYLERRECLAHAERFDELAEFYIAQAIAGTDTTPGSAIAVGHVETGRYSPSSESAVTP